MKRILIAFSMMFAMLSVSSQTLDEASTHVYYHRQQSAVATLKNLLQKGDHSPNVYYWLGESYLKLGYLDSAAFIFRREPVSVRLIICRKRSIR
ncbi:MAG: hypothetical protein IPG86_17410 [Chitinophagaceae bacterium]|nr:hypothetical protein [Chitinophagaceae bacterium]